MLAADTAMELIVDMRRPMRRAGMARFVALVATLAGCPGGHGPSVDAAGDRLGADERRGAPLEGGGDRWSGADGAGLLRAAHERADRALERLLLAYWNGAYLRDTAPDGGALAGYWVFAQSFDVILDGVERTGGRYAGLIHTFYLAQEARGWSADFFDDETWMTLALIRAYDVTGRGEYLDRAEALFGDIMASASDSSCCGPTPGGLWWDRKHTSKATASNAGPVIAGARLAARKQKPAYLEFAKKTYAYWFQRMVNPTTHQVADHIDPNGNVVWWKLTYNEGLMIGASLELYRATKEASYLTNAHDVASFMLGHETVSTPLGPVLTDGSNSGCAGDCPQFKGIAHRYLRALYEEDRARTAYRDVLLASADAAWALAQTPAGLFDTDWSTPPTSAAIRLPACNSAVMALGGAALLHGPYPVASAPGVRQAEEGVLHHVGLEASHLGFEGWGYLAGWNQDGQWVDFSFEAPAAGTYAIELRYAAGAGDASRLIYINGQPVVPNLVFSSTGSWDSWSTVTAQAALAAQHNTISVIYNQSLGSKSYLNLDRIAISTTP